jgi:hypothetical protein
MQDCMTMSLPTRKLAAVARKTAAVAASAFFLSSVFALGADEARSQLRLHAGHSAPALSSAMSIAGLAVLGLSKEARRCWLRGEAEICSPRASVSRGIR